MTPTPAKQSSETSRQLPWLQRWQWALSLLLAAAGVAVGIIQTIHAFNSGQPKIVVNSSQSNVAITMPPAGTSGSHLPVGPSHAAPTPATPRAQLYEAKVMVYRAAEIPKFSVNDGLKRPDEFHEGIATFLLPAGAYDIKAEYPERICEAVFSVPHEGEAEATCHLR
jgi:hypothetical protein